METEQAHSTQGRDAALRRPPVSPFPRTAQRATPLIWLNLVCLDAPFVAVVWLWLFARTFRIPLQIGNCVALFLTAWLIYLGDRMADSASLKIGSSQSLRQQFCRRHRELWIILLALVAALDAYVIYRTTALQTLVIGVVVGGLALVYLVLNHPLGLVWRSLPAKELMIGILFAAGTLVALLPPPPSVPIGFLLAAVFFAALCALNCISIAGWEAGLDRAQGKVSIATRHPRIARHIGGVALVLGSTSFAIAVIFRFAAPLLICIGGSAILLAWLNARAIDIDRRTALADLALLTPIVPLIVMAL